MSLSAANNVKVYKVFGIPKAGSAFVAYALTTLYGPAGERFDFSAVVLQLETCLAALSAEQQTEVETALARWDEITSYNPLQINRSSSSDRSSSGGGGTIVDYPREREGIRREISNIIGFGVPRAGFNIQAESGGGCGFSR